MTRVPIPLVRGEGKAKSQFVSSRTLVNCFIEYSSGRPALYGGPGMSLRKTMTTGHIRGIKRFGSVLLVVGGNRLYTLTEAGTETDRGEVLGASPVVITDNGTQAVIVAEDASKSYYWDGTTFGEITDADLLPAASADYIDQYIVFGVKDTGRFQISALADATSIDALDIATAETRPDIIRRVFVDNRDLLLCGADTIEGQYNSGAADFPFERSQLFFEVGLAGTHCIAAVDNTVVFLAADKEGGLTVRAIRGGTALIVSTAAIINTIESWDTPGDAQAFSFGFRNHKFWCLRHDDGCVVLDMSNPVAEDAWHVRKTYGTNTWSVAYAASIWDSIILADADTAKIYTLDADTHAEASTDLVRELVTEAMGPSGSYFTLNAVELLIEPGVGVLSGQGSDPEVWLQLSRNGGKTYGARMTRKIGARGDYERRIVWGGGFGQFRPEGGVIKLGCSDPVSLTIKGAFVDFTVDAT